MTPAEPSTETENALADVLDIIALLDATAGQSAASIDLAGEGRLDVRRGEGW
jgi:hypothetical protein